MTARPPVIESAFALVVALRHCLAAAALGVDSATAPDLAAGLAELDEACARFLRDLSAHRLAERRHG
jgi:hypothetical protein